MSTSPVTLSTPSVLAPAGSSPSGSSSSASNASQQQAIDALSNPDTFLQLLVAQLKYQDPQSPADGTAFVTQLATFSGVEEQSAMRSDLDAINSVARQWAVAQSAAGAAANAPGANSAPTAASSNGSADAGAAPSSGTGN